MQEIHSESEFEGTYEDSHGRTVEVTVEDAQNYRLEYRDDGEVQIIGAEQFHESTESFVSLL
jgi:hypothetical protein